MNTDNVKTNSLKAWILASRPKTLTAAVVPVMLGTACAWHDTHGEGMHIVAVVLCFLFAMIMQIDANFVNDYFDCLKGRDNNERLGPLRSCQQGWITMPKMKVAIIVSTIISALIGMPLVMYGGLELIVIGALCLAGCYMYTTFFSSKGLGDVLVLLFFGIIPCCFTYYVAVPETQQSFPMSVVMASVSCGLVIDTLLVVNNYRDIDNDRNSGKRTLVVMIGMRKTEIMYLLLVPVAIVILLLGLHKSITECAENVVISSLLMIPLVFVHFKTWRKMCSIRKGKALNEILGMAAKNILLFGILATIMIFLL